MQANIYILLVQNFFKFKGIEYAVPVGHENISLFPNVGMALDAKNEAAEMLIEKGYYSTDYSFGDNNPFVCFQCRYENDQDRAVVLTIIRKIVEGELCQF